MQYIEFGKQNQEVQEAIKVLVPLKIIIDFLEQQKL